MHPYNSNNTISSHSISNLTPIPRNNIPPNSSPLSISNSKPIQQNNSLPSIQLFLSHVPNPQNNPFSPSRFNVTHPSTLPLIPTPSRAIIQTTSPSPQVSRFTLQETIPPSPSLKRKSINQGNESTEPKRQKTTSDNFKVQSFQNPFVLKQIQNLSLQPSLKILEDTRKNIHNLLLSSTDIEDCNKNIEILLKLPAAIAHYNLKFIFEIITRNDLQDLAYKFLKQFPNFDFAKSIVNYDNINLTNIIKLVDKYPDVKHVFETVSWRIFNAILLECSNLNSEKELAEITLALNHFPNLEINKCLENIIGLLNDLKVKFTHPSYLIFKEEMSRHTCTFIKHIFKVAKNQTDNLFYINFINLFLKQIKSDEKRSSFKKIIFQEIPFECFQILLKNDSFIKSNLPKRLLKIAHIEILDLPKGSRYSPLSNRLNFLQFRNSEPKASLKDFKTVLRYEKQRPHNNKRILEVFTAYYQKKTHTKISLIFHTIFFALYADKDSLFETVPDRVKRQIALSYFEMCIFLKFIPAEALLKTMDFYIQIMQKGSGKAIQNNEILEIKGT